MLSGLESKFNVSKTKFYITRDFEQLDHAILEKG